MNKAKQISELKFTSNRQKLSKIFNYLREIFNGPKIDDEKPDTTEESAEQRRIQEGEGVKILTPNQMFSRLPIILAKLKAGNDFVKLKKEIRQILYSLYRSKKLTKEIYEGLTDII